MPMRKLKSIRRTVTSAAFSLALAVSVSPFASAEGSPIDAVDNLGNFLYDLIRSVGIAAMLFGIVQLGMSMKSHDPSQRTQGLLTLVGGLLFVFAKDIIDLITA